MSLVLTIVRQPQGTDVAKTRMTFGINGGTIGRNADNDWQLPDPDRFVSSRHASIRCENGQYYLVDTSTNGVYYNNTQEPLGTGNQAALSQGDKLYFGEYELSVEFEQSPAADNMSLNAFDQWLDPEPSVDFGEQVSDGSVGNDFLTESEELDPLAAFDKVSQGSNMPSSNTIPEDDWLGGGSSQADNAPANAQAFSLPESAVDQALPLTGGNEGSPSIQSNQSIPDDWDIDDLLGGGDSALPNDDLPPSGSEFERPQEAVPSTPVIPTPAATPPPSEEVLIPQPAKPHTEPASSSLDEIESLLSADIEQPDAQQDLQYVAQKETDELDAFLGLDDSAPSAIEEVPAAVPVEPPVSAHVEAEIQQEPEYVQEPVQDVPSKEPKPEAAVAQTETQVEALIEALGLDPEQITPEKRAHFNQLMADMLRESVKGMMAVLGARNAIKNEFRMNVTLIQAAENNPLKFSPNVDEALRNMLVAQSNAYLPGLLAVRDGFQDIADHQIAVIAGMREAFNSMMKQFDPKNLTVRFDKLQSRGGLMKGKSAKCWDSYTEFYQDLANNMDDSFQDLFGEDFAEAYEQQMNALAASRKQ